MKLRRIKVFLQVQGGLLRWLLETLEAVSHDFRISVAFSDENDRLCELCQEAALLEDVQLMTMRKEFIMARYVKLKNRREKMLRKRP